MVFFLLQNMLLNTQAEYVEIEGKQTLQGSSTETALYAYAEKITNRDRVEVLSVVPFSSETKIMQSRIKTPTETIDYLKGAPEKVLLMCELDYSQRQMLLREIELEQSKGKRCLAFAHKQADKEKYF